MIEHRGAEKQSSRRSRRGTHSSSRIRMRHQHLLGEFESGHSLLAADAREVLQELAQAIAGLQVVEQGANRNPGADKNRSFPEDIGVAVDHRWGRSHRISPFLMILPRTDGTKEWTSMRDIKQ